MKAAVIHVPHANLSRHPRNMRLHYPLADVRRMGVSQLSRVRSGLEPCIQPLIITLGPRRPFDPRRHDPLHTRFTIVAGHLRHAGNAWLGDRAPLLNCLVRDYPDDQAMLAEMRAENGVRAEVSPLGWARHFQDALAADPALTPRHLARESGRSLHFVQLHLNLLQLEPSVQTLIDEGRLPLMSIPLLLKLEDRAVQAQAAGAFARRRVTLRGVRRGVELLLADRPARAPGGRPAVDGLPPRPAATLAEARAAARETCLACDIGQRLPLAEPAWHLAARLAGETCECCGLQNVKDACHGCPLAEMMGRLARAAAQEAK